MRARPFKKTLKTEVAVELRLVRSGRDVGSSALNGTADKNFNVFGSSELSKKIVSAEEDRLKKRLGDRYEEYL